MVSACIWALLPRASRVVVRTASYGADSLSWRRSFQYVDSRAANLGLFLTRISCQCYSYKRPTGHEKSGTQAMLKDEKEAFFVVRKGDIVGVYKSLSDCQAQVGSSHSCTLEFDGSSKGNPGQSGAGVVLRADDGSWICRLREGLGIATFYVSQYQAIILGLQYALDKGFTSIHVQGDSDLVCMQIQGLWKVKDKNISILYEKAKSVKDKFTSFRIIHVQKMVKFKGKLKEQLMSEYHKKHSMARKSSVRFVLGVKLIPAMILSNHVPQVRLGL